MVKAKTRSSAVSHLKKKISLLQRREKAQARQLQKALKTIKSLGLSYEKKLVTHLQKMKAQIAAAEAAAYMRAAREIETQVQKKILAKQKDLGKLVMHYEKNFAARLSRFLQDRAKRLTK